MPACSCSIQTFETLESRVMFSSAPYLGTFKGIDTYIFDGVKQNVKTTITIAPINTTSAISPLRANQAGLKFAHAFGPFTFLAISEVIAFSESLNSDAISPGSLKNHTDRVTPQSTTSLVADFPSALGTGTIQVSGNTLTILGTIDTGIFAPAPVNFTGTRVTASAAPAAVPPPAPAPETPSLFKTLSLDQTFSVNPAIGTFLGHMTRASDSVALKTSAVIAKNSKGHTAITFQLAEPGIGTIVIQSVIHPTHTGAFTLPLGNSVFDGTLSGHVTHTKRLVIHLIVPQFSSLVGTEVRH
jgi:hypothetical protein